MPTEDYAQQIRDKLGEWWLPRIYSDRILRLRTRPYHFENLKPNAQIAIQHTLLGVELKVGSRRFLCPDLATARYLSVFSRAGCRDVAIPYDITKISRLADELESAWCRMLLLIDHEAKGKTQRFRTRLRGLLFATIRIEIANSGVGAPIPEFKPSVKHRRG